MPFKYNKPANKQIGLLDINLKLVAALFCGIQRIFNVSLCRVKMTPAMHSWGIYKKIQFYSEKNVIGQKTICHHFWV